MSLADGETPAAHTRNRGVIWGTRALLILLGLMLPLVAIEVGIRLFGPILPGYYFTGELLVTHPEYGRFHALNYDGWMKTSEYTSHVTVNSLGLRGPERPYAKPDGVKRVLVLGDSFSEAVQVEEHEGVVALIERELNASGTGQYEAINAAVAGWGQNQQYAYLLNEGKLYQPDLVVVVMYLGNDLLDTSWELQGRPKRPVEPYWVVEKNGKLRRLKVYDRAPDDRLIHRLLIDRTVAWNVLNTGLFSHYTGSDEPDEPQDGWRLSKHAHYKVSKNSRVDAAWRTEVALLNAITAESAKLGAKTAVVVVPGMFQVYDSDWKRLLRENKLKASEWSQTKPNRVLADLMPEIEAPVLDMLPALRERAPSLPPLYFVRDRHWTRDGHVFAAREILDFLRARELVP